MSDTYLSDAGYQQALQRFRDQIGAGLELEMVDDDTVGAKQTYCSWGLCSTLPGAWPAEDRLYEDLPYGKYRSADQPCPLDQRPREDADPIGCFYHCRMFQAKKGELPDRAAAVALYSAALAPAPVSPPAGEQTNA
jgi:hypothetical protein